MFDFLIRNTVVKSTQTFVDRLNPKVQIHVPKELPLPSINIIKKNAATVAKINALEAQVSQWSESQLQAKTPEFQQRYQAAIQSGLEEFKKAQEEYKNMNLSQDREVMLTQFEKAKEDFKKIKQSALDSLLPEAFAVVREVSKRILAMRHFDTQLIGGMVLHQGCIA